MKKFLNGLGVSGSIILSFILTILIFVYAVILNIKAGVGENGLSKMAKKIDFVEILKTTEDGTM